MLHSLALRYFVEVAKAGSLAGASEHLHVAISAISRQISKLEQEVGAALFERMPRGMVLTAAGEALAQHARRVLLEDAAVLDDIAATHSSGGVGVVRVGCTEGFTLSFLPAMMVRHQAQYPQATFVLRAGTPGEVAHWVEIGEVDLGVTFSTGGSTEVRIEYSVEVPVCAVLRPTHPLAQQDVLTLAELSAYPIALMERGTTVRQLFDWCCSVQKLTFDVVLNSNSSSALYAFAAATDAIALGSRLSLSGSAREPALTARRIDEPLLDKRVLQVTTMRERRLPAAVETFIAALIASLQTTMATPLDDRAL